MIDQRGTLTMLPHGTTLLPESAPPGAVLAYGTEDDLRAVAHRVKLGHREVEARKARRKNQRASRRTNRR